MIRCGPWVITLLLLLVYLYIDTPLCTPGANDENQLGRRASQRHKNNLEPYEIAGRRKLQSNLHGIVKITGGAYHTLYINAQGELWAFGCNNCGQLGLGDTEAHLNGPERVQYYVDGEDGVLKELPPIVDVAAGESHSLALARYVYSILVHHRYDTVMFIYTQSTFMIYRDGRLFAFGANLEGQLGFRMQTDDYHQQVATRPRLITSGAQHQWTEESEHGLPPHTVDPVVMVDAQSRHVLASICNSISINTNHARCIMTGSACA